VGHIATLFQMHEANAVVIYSQQLAEQIPPSYAAHAFNQFQRSMHLFEILRLCALWDKVREDRESIPTIIALFDKPELIDQLEQEAHASYANEAQQVCLRRSENPEDMAAINAWSTRFQADIATEQTKRIREYLSFATNKAQEVQTSPQLKALMDLRNNYIAHNLDVFEPDIKAEASVDPVKYGDETILLEKTVAIANALQHGLNREGFDWGGSQKIARRNARALWDNCTFQSQTRPAQ
jgi:hypothetical protein